MNKLNIESLLNDQFNANIKCNKEYRKSQNKILRRYAYLAHKSRHTNTLNITRSNTQSLAKQRDNI